MVATAATLISEIIGKARRDGKIFYHINDGVYHTFSGVVYDHWIPNFHAFGRGKKKFVRLSGPPATVLTRFPFPNSFPEI